MPDVAQTSQWFEIAKYIGAGATFVLGPISYLLWGAYREEVAYSKLRDKETLNVLASLTKVIQDDSAKGEREENSLKNEMKDLKNSVNELIRTIREHVTPRA